MALLSNSCLHYLRCMWVYLHLVLQHDLSMLSVSAPSNYSSMTAFLCVAFLCTHILYIDTHTNISAIGNSFVLDQSKVVTRGSGFFLGTVALNICGRRPRLTQLLIFIEDTF
jgi:hypothetical protein